MSEPIIGIDLGTTNTCISYLVDNIPKVIPNHLGFKTTPSFVTYKLAGSNMNELITKVSEDILKNNGRLKLPKNSNMPIETEMKMCQDKLRESKNDTLPSTGTVYPEIKKCQNKSRETSTETSCNREIREDLSSEGGFYGSKPQTAAIKGLSPFAYLLSKFFFRPFLKLFDKKPNTGNVLETPIEVKTELKEPLLCGDSIHFFDDKPVVVGQVSKALQSELPKSTIFAFKRLLGRKSSDEGMDEYRKSLSYETHCDRNGDILIKIPSLPSDPSKRIDPDLQDKKTTAPLREDFSGNYDHDDGTSTKTESHHIGDELITNSILQGRETAPISEKSPVNPNNDDGTSRKTESSLGDISTSHNNDAKQTHTSTTTLNNDITPFKPITSSKQTPDDPQQHKPKLISPQQVSADLLRYMKECAEHVLKVPIKKAVITVPAYFNDTQRSGVKAAGKSAGLEVLRVLSEPTAAALAYGLNKKDHLRIVVYDLGGGTFDVSLLEMCDGVFEVIGVNGDSHLGGEDIDIAIMNDAIKRVKALEEGFKDPLRANYGSGHSGAERLDSEIGYDTSTRVKALKKGCKESPQAKYGRGHSGAERLDSEIRTDAFTRVKALEEGYKESQATQHKNESDNLGQYSAVRSTEPSDSDLYSQSGGLENETCTLDNAIHSDKKILPELDPSEECRDTYSNPPNIAEIGTTREVENDAGLFAPMNQITDHGSQITTRDASMNTFNAQQGDSALSASTKQTTDQVSQVTARDKGINTFGPPQGDAQLSAHMDQIADHITQKTTQNQSIDTFSAPQCDLVLSDPFSQVSDLTSKFGSKIFIAEDFTITALKDQVEKLKIHLSTNQECRLLIIPKTINPRRAFLLSYKKQDIEALAQPFIQRTIQKCSLALKDAKINKDSIDHIILVGGATRMPSVQSAIQHFFNKKPNKSVDPDLAVSLGASIQGGIIDNTIGAVLLDVNSLSLGIETIGGVFSKVIERNSKIPSRKSQVYTNSEDGQKEVIIRVYQGERPLVKMNKFLGEFRLVNLQSRKKGEHRIEVVFECDVNGILVVKAKDLLTNKEQQIVVKHESGLTEEEISRVIVESERLKASDDFLMKCAEFKIEMQKLLDHDGVSIELANVIEKYLKQDTFDVDMARKEIQQHF